MNDYYIWRKHGKNNLKSSLRYLFILTLITLAQTAYSQAVKGRVIDAEDGSPLLFAHVVYNIDKKLGVTTDDKGYFVIDNYSDIKEVEVSTIGYKTATFVKSDVPRTGTWTILLDPNVESLNEVELMANENPALRIIRNTIKNKEVNDPKLMDSYYYRSYNKNLITYDLTADSAMSSEDSAQWKEDVIQSKTNHLLVIESVTEKFFKEPNNQKEVVIGTRISGFEEPNFGMVPNDVGHFAFYDNTIKLTNKVFLNPIADGADDNYVYFIYDTLYTIPGDTTFVIKYYPESGANFDGFKGIMHINTRHWAIEYVSAEPFNKGKIHLFIEQMYTLQPNDVWFPTQLNFELTLEKVPFRNQGAVLKGKSFLDSIQIDIPIPDSVFSVEEVELDKKAGKVKEEFWEIHRKEELSVKEKATYKKMEEIGDKYEFDFILRSTRHAYQGFLAFGPINVEARKLIAYNDYEGLRLGAGLYTNEEVSEHFSVGGYFGYGFNDKAWKYGTRLQLNLSQKHEITWSFDYQNDVKNPGGINLYYWRKANFANQFFNTEMDLYEQKSTTFAFRLWKYSQFSVGFGQAKHSPTYFYQFTPIPVDSDGSQTFTTTEARLNWRWLYKERLVSNFGQRISMGSNYPVINIAYARGLQNVWDGQFDYNKVELGVKWDHYTAQLGRTLITLEAGFIDNAVPYSLAFGGRPSFNPSFSVVVKNTFQTMRFNEFASDQYAALFLMHDFGPLLLRSGWFRPEFRYFQGISFGSLKNKEFHKGFDFKSLDKGFYESGIVMDNIIRFNLFNTGYLGLGAGAFYRYGPNHLPVMSDNWTFKISFAYQVN